jgi:superfamily I DNA/RNA helicase
VELTSNQREILSIPLSLKQFLSGPAGCGKTTVGVERLKNLITGGQPADSILVLTPQRTLQLPYEKALLSPEMVPGGMVTLATIGGLARRLVNLFWPLISEVAGFSHPTQPPVFLTLETAQYYMARLVRPLLDEGFFASVTIDRTRLYSQILDNLNKAASVGFPYSEIGERLSTAWNGDPGQRRIYADAQECANRFRKYCLENNLLDFSLQLDIFRSILWQRPECHDYLVNQYKHLIFDNMEEDIPVAHTIVSEWLPGFDSALLIFDTEAGYRRFLGADPDSAWKLKGNCENFSELNTSFVSSPRVQALENAFSARFSPRHTNNQSRVELDGLHFSPASSPSRFFPQMLDWVILEIQNLLSEGMPGREIVVLAPYFSDSLRFSLSNRLDGLGIAWHSHRPSRSLRDEPASQCLLTLAALAHPDWEIRPTRYEVATMLNYSINGLDWVRAQLLSEIVYRERTAALSKFAGIRPEIQERITFLFGQQYELLRDWIEAYQNQPSPDLFDHFFRRLFGEVLSQNGFTLHQNMDGARTVTSLIESVQKFRLALEAGGQEVVKLGQEYMSMLQEGVIAAQYLEAWSIEPADSILLAPAHTFLMLNRPASVQFWLDVGSNGWWERLFQPLTQPYVLSRSWDQDRKWTDTDDQESNQAALGRLVSGLLHRCRERVYLGLSDLGESGFEQRGPLLKAIWKLQMESLVNDGK